MAHVFCTLKQAADKLGTTEARIKDMLDSGTLREFRDGSDRLLKVSDLSFVDIVPPPASDSAPEARTQHKAKSPSHESGHRNRTSSHGGACRKSAGQVAGPSTRQIKLPPAAAVIAPAVRPRLQPFERSSPSGHQHSTVEDLAYPTDFGGTDHSPQPSRSSCPTDLGSHPKSRPAAGPRRPAAKRPALPRSRQRPPTYDMSLRQWLWMGLLDDQPFAILLLFATIALGIGTVAGAIYLLVQSFWP